MMIHELLTLQNLKEFGNSAFTTSLVGALAGAFFGARAAQKIAERGKQSDLLIAEFRSTNAALTTAFAICNKAMAFKRQHAGPVYEKFCRDRETLEAYERRAASGEGLGERFEFQADLRSLPAVVMPVQAIETLVFDKLSSVGRPLVLVNEFSTQLTALNSTIDTRAQLIVELGEVMSKSSSEFASRYFGISSAHVHDTRYPDTLKALVEIANYLIFFSELLCIDLAEHGETLKKRARKLKLKIKLGDVSALDFSEARAAGLMPKHSDYQDFLKGFVKKPEPPTRWRRVLEFFGRRPAAKS